MKESIEKAIEVLKSGGVILYPTDTIWGLGCDACNADAVEKIYKIKRRAESKSLVLLCSDLDMLTLHVREIPSMAIDLIEVNDAPMTIIYPHGQSLAANVCASDGSVGIRIPYGEHYCKTLTARLRRPLVSTSANISGEPSPASFDEISDEIKAAVDYIVPTRFDTSHATRASQIIKLGLRGEVEIIRK